MQGLKNVFLWFTVTEVKLKEGWLDYRFCSSWFQYLHFYTNAISICLGRLHRWGYLDNSLLSDGARAALAGVQTLFHRETAAMRFQPLHKQVIDSSKVVIAFVLKRLWQEKKGFWRTTQTRKENTGKCHISISTFWKYSERLFFRVITFANQRRNYFWKPKAQTISIVRNWRTGSQVLWQNISSNTIVLD